MKVISCKKCAGTGVLKTKNSYYFPLNTATSWNKKKCHDCYGLGYREKEVA